VRMSPAGVAFLQGWESCALTAYQDGVRVWTIGWGRTMGVRPGDVCTAEQADDWLRETLEEYAEELEGYLFREPTQQQFDALLDLGYNAGVSSIGDSGLMSRFNAELDQECADRFLLWNRSGGRVVNGLTKRRRGERAIYLNADYSHRP